MNSFKQEKLTRFANDIGMSEAVYEVVKDAFLKSKGQKDVQILAAERLALDFLDNAWKEIEKYKAGNITEEKSTGNIGL